MRKHLTCMPARLIVLSGRVSRLRHVPTQRSLQHIHSYSCSRSETHETTIQSTCTQLDAQLFAVHTCHHYSHGVRPHTAILHHMHQYQINGAYSHASTNTIVLWLTTTILGDIRMFLACSCLNTSGVVNLNEPPCEVCIIFGTRNKNM